MGRISARGASSPVDGLDMAGEKMGILLHVLSLEGEAAYAPWHVRGGLRCRGLSGNGFILVEGDAEIGGSGEGYEGILVVTGDLVLRGARYDGSLFVLGRIRVEGVTAVSGTVYALGGFHPQSTHPIVLDGRLWMGREGTSSFAVGLTEKAFACRTFPIPTTLSVTEIEAYGI
ncbi:MAG: hypothetical protein V1918_04905 [Planctomycetota bacterium]